MNDSASCQFSNKTSHRTRVTHLSKFETILSVIPLAIIILLFSLTLCDQAMGSSGTIVWSDTDLETVNDEGQKVKNIYEGVWNGSGTPVPSATADPIIDIPKGQPRGVSVGEDGTIYFITRGAGEGKGLLSYWNGGSPDSVIPFFIPNNTDNKDNPFQDPRFIDVADGKAYWTTNPGGVFYCDISDCAGTLQNPVASGGVWGIEFDPLGGQSGQIYYADDGSNTVIARYDIATQVITNVLDANTDDKLKNPRGIDFRRDNGNFLLYVAQADGTILEKLVGGPPAMAIVNTNLIDQGPFTSFFGLEVDLEHSRLLAVARTALEIRSYNFDGTGMIPLFKLTTIPDDDPFDVDVGFESNGPAVIPELPRGALGLFGLFMGGMVLFIRQKKSIR